MKSSQRTAFFASLLLLGSIAGCAEQETVPFEAYVTLDINPSIAFVVNERELVQAVHPLNEDGELALLHLSLEETPLSQALHTYVEEVMRLGFWPESPDQVLVEIDVTSSRLAVEQLVNTKVQAQLQQQLATHDAHFLIRTRQYDTTVQELATQMGVRAKELRMMDHAMMSDPSQPLSAYRAMTNQALVQRIRNQAEAIRSIAYPLRDEFFQARDQLWTTYQASRQAAQAEHAQDSELLETELSLLEESYQLAVQDLRTTYQNQTLTLRTELEEMYQQRLAQHGA